MGVIHKERILKIKSDIRDSIINKGVDVPLSDSMELYSGYIDSIQSGGNSGYNVPREDIWIPDIYNNTSFLTDPEYPDLTQVQKSDNEIYLVYHNDFDGINSLAIAFQLVTTSQTITITKGYISGNQYIAEETLTSSLKNATTFTTTITSTHKFYVLKVTSTSQIKNWYIPNSATINGTTAVDARLHQRLIEGWGKLPSFNGTGSANNSTTSWSYTERVTIENASTSCNTLANFFNSAYALKEFRFINCNFSNVTSINSMFNACYSLREIDLSPFNFVKVTNLGNVFSNCPALQFVNITGASSSVLPTTLYQLFYNCYSLKTVIGLNTINTSKSTTFYYTFGNCFSLEEIDISSWVITNVCTNVSYMFSTCWSLRELKLSGSWDLSGVTGTYLRNLFTSCSILDFSKHDLSKHISNFNVSSKVTTLISVFQNCLKLYEIDLSKWNLSGITSLEATFSSCNNVVSINFGSQTMNSLASLNQTFYNCHSLKSLDLSNVYINMTGTAQYLFGYCYSLQSLKFFKGVAAVTSLFNFFLECRSLVNIENLSTLSTDTCTTFSAMFSGCRSLKNLNISFIKVTTSCTTLANMFTNCYNVENIEFDSSKVHDGSKVTTITNIFDYCFNVKTIKIPFALAPTNVNYAFRDCRNLEIVIATNFDMSKATSATTPFVNAFNLINLNILKLPSIALNMAQLYRPTESQLMSILSTLPNVSSKTLTLGKPIYAKLSATNKAVITGKGWTIA